MILLAAIAALGVQATAEADQPVDPADWECAQPLIDRNFRRDIDAEQLALRIADECTRPFEPRQINDEADRVFEGMARTTYRYQTSTFKLDIEQRIQQARRRVAIPLD